MSSETEYREYRVEATEDFAFDYADGPTSVYVTNDVPVGVQTLIQSATSTSLDNIHFDVTNTPTRGISTHAYVRFPKLVFTVTDPDVAASTTPELWATNARSFKDIALRPYGLMNMVTSSMLVHLNNRPINEFSNLKEIVPLLHKITDTSKQMPWLINNVGDLYQEYSDYDNLDSSNNLKPRLGPDSAPCYLPFIGDLDTPFIVDDQLTRLNNRRLIPSYISSAAGTLSFALYNVILPIPLSVFTSNTKSSKAIYGIEKLGIRFNLNPDAREMFSCKPVGALSGVAWGRNPIRITTDKNPELVLKVFTPPQHVENSLRHPTLPQYVKDFTLPVMDTQLHQQIPMELQTSQIAGGSISKGATKSTQFNNIVLDHVPEYLYLQIVKTGQGNLSKCYVPDVGCRIDKLSVNVNGTETFTAAEALDIAQLNSRNGFTVSPTHQLYVHGNSFVIIDVKKDLGIPSNVVVNQHQPLTIRIHADCTNLRVLSTAKVMDQFTARLYSSSTDLLCYSKGQFKTSKFMDRLSPADYDMLKTSVKEYLLRRDANVVGAGMHGGFLGSLFKKVLPLVKKYGWSAIRGAYDGVRKQMKDDKGGFIRPSGNNIIGGLSVGSREWS